MADETLLALAADIISAHVSNNSVATDQLPQLIEAVYGSLASLGQTPAPVEESRAPAVSVRASVKPDGIVCLECGRKFKMLKSHLTSDHAISVEEYRQRWSLPASYPVVSSEYAEKRRALARATGLGRKGGRKKADTAKGAHSSSEVGTAPDVGVPAPEAKPKKKPDTKAATKPRKKLGISAG